MVSDPDYLKRLRVLSDQLVDPEVLEQILDSLPDALLVVDQGGTIKRINYQLELMFGYGRIDLLDQHFEMLLPQEMRTVHAEHVRRYFAEPHVRPHYFTMPVRRPMNLAQPLPALHRDGTTFTVTISIGPLVSAYGVWALALIRRAVPVDAS